MNMKEIAERLEGFKDCKGLIIIGVEDVESVEQEYRKAIRRMGYSAGSNKYLVINSEKNGRHAYIYSKKLSAAGKSLD